MPIRHRLLAVLVAVLWGANFIAIHASLAIFPPFLCSALRFLLLAIPTVLLVPRPQVPTRWLVGYGIGFGVLQFAFLYLAMDIGMPTGLASLVLQSSAPFTVVLGAVLLGERLSGRAATGVGVAAPGMAVVGSQRLSAEAGLLPFVLTLLAGLGWAFGNLAARRAAAPKPLHLTMWMTVVPPLPLLALSLAVEGPERIGVAFSDSLTAAAIPAWLGLAYTTIIATVIGSGIWTRLMSRHPSGTVAPFSMLVPVTGLALAWATLGEVPAPLELAGGVLVVGGVLWASRHRPTALPEPEPLPEPVAHRV
ncbi:EamA family transporter [Janibacter limosus]|uniref:EamA family transporter n=1 Tax=Janibacter limosus TaxID=53458 RepID=UPI0035E005CB|nr:EamA family transporter [Janibacter limosus]